MVSAAAGGHVLRRECCPEKWRVRYESRRPVLERAASRSRALQVGLYSAGRELRMSRMPYSIPLEGHAISNVEGDARFVLVFDDPLQSRMYLDGSFSIGTQNERDVFDPPCEDWVRDVLLSLAGVKISAASYNSQSYLRISFEDGRDLSVDDGPYENWHYTNSSGTCIHGGVGRTS